MQEIKEYYKIKKQQYADYIKSNDLHLSLVIFQVGDNPASNRYVKNKMKDCESVGIKCSLYKYTEDITEENLIIDIKLACSLQMVTGVMVQLPLPAHINEENVMAAISETKDVDGFNKLSKCNPCTPQGIITYLEDQQYVFTNKNTVVIGRSNIVGRPIAKMLLDRDANVTVVHSKTSESSLRNYLMTSDLVVCAVGKRNVLENINFLYKNKDSFYINNKCFVIDVGINFTEDGKLVGDCEKLGVCEKTPVPGGVGLLTRLAVIENLIKLHS